MYTRELWGKIEKEASYIVECKGMGDLIIDWELSYYERVQKISSYGKSIKAFVNILHFRHFIIKYMGSWNEKR